jgi:hypothetical protein
VLGTAAACSGACVFGVEPMDQLHAPPAIGSAHPRFAVGDDEFRLHLKPTDDVLAELVGFTAPAEWAVVGVATGATIRHLDAADPRRTGWRCTLTHAVTRDGYSISVLRPEHDAEAEPTYLESDDPVVGLTADACRRVLGLPTPPPVTTARFALSWLWMDAVVEAATRRPGLTMQDCWLLHPALPLAAPGDPRSLAERCRRAADAADWSTLRQQVIAGDEVVGLDSVDAAWCDDGSFSRFVLTMLPEPLDLLAAMRQLLPLSVLDQLLEAFATLLEPSAHSDDATSAARRGRSSGRTESQS